MRGFDPPSVMTLARLSKFNLFELTSARETTRRHSHGIPWRVPSGFPGGPPHGSRGGRTRRAGVRTNQYPIEAALSAAPPRQAASVMLQSPDVDVPLEIVMYIGLGTILVVLLIIYFVRRT
jgi:hypothetical protein